MNRRFKLTDRIANRQGATVLIEDVAAGFLFTVRPRGLRTTYTLTLDDVADMVCWKVAKADADADAKAGARRRARVGLKTVLGSPK